tara:strand:- start:21307 stop:22518 length:1212 start_codon:yes stop_codon:yes gene_type:complete
VIYKKMALKDINTTPTSGMRSEAKKGLEWRKEFGRGGTAIGVARARDIINGDLSLSSIKRMFSFHSRHQVDKKAEGYRPGEKGYPSAGRIAIALWGGDSGFSWSKKKVAQIKKEEENRMKVGTMITDGIELPLYDSKEEAESEAKRLGGVGFHEHTLDDNTYYMPFKNHEQAKEVMGKVDENMYGSKEDDEDKKNNRYIMENKETRIYNGNLEVRMDEDSKETRVSGYAALFDTDSRDLGFRETISKRAFDGRLEDNVILTYNHDANLLLDRNIGGTLRLSVDERGLRYDATLPDTTAGKDVAELMKRGLLYESSFAFTVEEDDWSKDGDTTRRQINKIGRLVDVSIVGVGAYANTDVALRSKEVFEKEDTEEVIEVKQEIKESFDDSKLNLLSNELKLKKRI